MCGICGVHDSRGVGREDVARMTRALRHRGPDDEGIVLDRIAALGHRRLSIIDLAGGHQPMANEDDSLWITFNGEIYNHAELRAKLEPRYRFKTNSDTEVLLHLYEERGSNCLRDLRGMFAFAIYDRRRDRFFMARDHLGQKPLYYSHVGGRLAFASEIKGLLALDPSLRELDGEALCEYIALRIITPPRSMFRAIRKLPPAHSLTYEDGRVTVERYWELRYEPKLRLGFDDAVEELDQRLRAAVEYHLVSDVPVGAFLSGGLDSSLVVAMMRGVVGGPFKTFTGDLPYGERSELPYARLVAQRYGTDSHELTITASLARSLPRVIAHLDEPSDPLSTCLYALSEFTRKEVKVVLGGDGGDELFAGYDRYYGQRYAGYLALLPRWLRQRVLGKLLERLPQDSWYRSAGHRLRWLLDMSSSAGSARYARSLRYFYFSDDDQERLVPPRFRKSIALFDPEENIRRHFDASGIDEIVDRMLYADQATRLPDHPVMILDRMTMAHGLEARSPFLDHEIAEFCASLPPRFKIRGTRRRLIQMALARRYLPREILTRDKQGFSSAFTYMLARSFGRIFRSFLEDSRLVRDGYFEPRAIAELLRQHLAGNADHGNRLWLLCNSELWYRMLIEGASAEDVEDQFRRALADGGDDDAGTREAVAR